MPSLERAITTTEQIRDALASEIVNAREQRVLIRRMDVPALSVRAAQRAGFNEQLAALQRTLAADLAAVAQDLGLAEVTLEGLRLRMPVLGQKMSAVLAEVRALASALSELDGLNRMLGQRALSYVRAHLAVISPRPSAYDRRGASGSAGVARASTIVRVL